MQHCTPHRMTRVESAMWAWVTLMLLSGGWDTHYELETADRHEPEAQGSLQLWCSATPLLWTTLYSGPTPSFPLIAQELKHVYFWLQQTYSKISARSGELHNARSGELHNALHSSSTMHVSGSKSQDKECTLILSQHQTAILTESCSSFLSAPRLWCRGVEWVVVRRSVLPRNFEPRGTV